MTDLNRFVAVVASQSKIAVAKPIVELDGDEMTRVIWSQIKEKVGLVLIEACGKGGDARC